MNDGIDIAAILYKVADALRFYDRIKALPDCNTCVIRGCEYMPKYGDYTRINCPHWKGEAQEDEKEISVEKQA